MNFVNSQLFKDVQLAEVFADSKMFADAVPNLSWQSACELYQLVGPLKGDELRKFVMSNFVFADQSIPTAKLETASVSLLSQCQHCDASAAINQECTA